MSITDLIAGVFAGATIPGALQILWISNIIYQVTPVMAGSFWVMYSLRSLYDSVPKWIPTLLEVLFGFFCVFVLLSPVCGTVFTLDEYNNYHRGSLIFLLWIYEYTLMFLPSIIAFLRRKKSKDWKPIFLFLIAPAIGCVLQNIFYGLTTTQAGITISALEIYVMLQGHEISEERMKSRLIDQLSRTDTLTGLPNRRACDLLVDQIDPSSALGVVFFDMNGLKRVNDSLGHASGDQLVINFARLADSIVPSERVFRVSGDEFLILLTDISREDFEIITNKLRSAVADRGDIAAMGCSYAAAAGNVRSVVHDAEKEMYADKRRYYLETGHDRRQ